MNDLVGQISKVQGLVRLIFLYDAPKAISAGLSEILNDSFVIIEKANECGEFQAGSFSSLLRDSKQSPIEVFPFSNELVVSERLERNSGKRKRHENRKIFVDQMSERLREA